MSSLANNLKAARTAANLSQTALAQRAGVSQQLIAALEKGQPTTSKIPEIARALEIAPGDLDPRLDGVGRSPNVTFVSLIDKVTAGKLAEPTSQIPVEDVPLLAFADLGSGEFFATRVDGTSMDRISPDGSIIVVNRNDKQLVSGKYYLFAHRGETTFKRWQGGDPSYLEPFSTDVVHKPIFIKRKRDFEVIGRVKRSVLDL